MRHPLAAALAAIVAVTALAAPVQFLFDVELPTTRVDGDPLPNSEIETVQFFEQCDTQPTPLFTVPNDGTPYQVTVDRDEGVLSFCFNVTDQDGVGGLMSDAYNLSLDFIGQPGKGRIRSILVTCGGEQGQRCKFVQVQ